jgi:hypothetical protein
MQAHPLRPSKSRIVRSFCGKPASMRVLSSGDSNFSAPGPQKYKRPALVRTEVQEAEAGLADRPIGHRLSGVTNRSSRPLCR